MQYMILKLCEVYFLWNHINEIQRLYMAWDRGHGDLISKLVLTYIILVILAARERNFDKFKSGGLHEKHAVATSNLGTVSAFAYETEENQENLCRDGRSQDLPDTHWLLASSLANRTVGRFPSVSLACVVIALLILCFTRHVQQYMDKWITCQE
jgi:hypothetical protein